MAEKIHGESIEQRASPRIDTSRVSIGTLAWYTLPVSGLALFVFYIQSVFFYFATDILLIAPAVISAIFGAGRIWDAISDPLAGYWSDRTKTRIGRRRPWMLAALVPLALSFLMIWNPPLALTGNALIVWCALGLFGFYTAFTVYAVPHYSLGTELTTDYHERSKVFGAHSAMFTIGMLMSFGGMHIVMNATDQRQAASVVSIGAVAVAIFLLLFAPVLVRERPELLGRGSDSPFRAIRDVLGNPHARRLCFVRCIESLGSAVLVTLAPHVSVYILKRPDMTALLPAFFVGATISSIPIWIWLSRRFGKRNVWVIGLAGVGMAFGSMFFVGEGDLVLLCTLLSIGGFFQGCGGVVGPSILADVIDYDEYHSHERKEGAYSAAWGFAFKLGMGSMIMLIGPVLQLAGFKPGGEQVPETIWAMKSMYAGIPFAVGLVGAVLMSRFSFNEAEHSQVRAELEARNENRVA